MCWEEFWPLVNMKKSTRHDEVARLDAVEEEKNTRQDRWGNLPVVNMKKTKKVQDTTKSQSSTQSEKKKTKGREICSSDGWCVLMNDMTIPRQDMMTATQTPNNVMSSYLVILAGEMQHEVCVTLRHVLGCIGNLCWLRFGRSDLVNYFWWQDHICCGCLSVCPPQHVTSPITMILHRLLPMTWSDMMVMFILHIMRWQVVGDWADQTPWNINCQIDVKLAGVLQHEVCDV
jgi:hypothetical protein